MHALLRAAQLSCTMRYLAYIPISLITNLLLLMVHIDQNPNEAVVDLSSSGGHCHYCPFS